MSSTATVTPAPPGCFAAFDVPPGGDDVDPAPGLVGDAAPAAGAEAAAGQEVPLPPHPAARAGPHRERAGVVREHGGRGDVVRHRVADRGVAAQRRGRLAHPDARRQLERAARPLPLEPDDHLARGEVGGRPRRPRPRPRAAGRRALRRSRRRLPVSLLGLSYGAAGPSAAPIEHRALREVASRRGSPILSEDGSGRAGRASTSA